MTRPIRVPVELTSDEARRMNAVAERSQVDVRVWLHDVVICGIGADEAHFREMDARDAAARAVDREDLRRMIERSTGVVPTAGLLDVLTDKIAVARTEGRAGLELCARAARRMKIVADIALKEDE